MAASSPDDSSPSWQENRTLAETNLHMMEHEILCDVTFLAGKAETPVKAHKYMLVSRSPVFYAMFCGPMAEAQDVIAVPDVEPHDLKELFRFMYTEECTVSGDNVMVLLYAANKYSVVNLAQTCNIFLTEHLGPDNVCMILQQAITFNESELVESCMSVIAEHGNDVLTSEHTKLLNEQTLKKIVEHDKLSIDEEHLYKRCVEWAKHQCETTGKEVNDQNIRECLGEILYLIRFPTISMETFTTVVSTVDLLTPEEKVEVFQSYVGITSSPRTFSTVPRLPPRQSVIIQRFENISAGWSHSNKPDAIAFSSSTTDLFLVGVCLFTPTAEGSVEGHLEILAGDQVLYRQEVKITYDKSKKFQDITFSRKIQLRKDNKYTFKQTMQGEPTCYGGEGQSNVSVDGVEVAFYKSEKDNNGTSPGGGQLYRLILEYLKAK